MENEYKTKNDLERPYSNPETKYLFQNTSELNRLEQSGLSKCVCNSDCRVE